MQNSNLVVIPVDQLRKEIKRIMLVTLQEHNKLNQQKPVDKEAKYLTRKETAEILQISLNTLHDWTKKGIITGHRIGNSVRYKKADIDKALQKIST